MSRYNGKSRDGRDVAYGYAPADGFFYQTFDAQGELLEEVDSLSNGLTSVGLLSALTAMDVSISTENYMCLMLDIPI